MNSSINNNVNIGGLQEIDGIKRFLEVIRGKSDIPYTSAPAQTTYDGLAIQDSNNSTWASFEGVQYNSGTNAVQMTVRGNSGTLSRMYIQENSDGKVTYNYGQTVGTGWMKLPRTSGNALLICWGQATLKTGDVVTFPTAFSATPVVNVSMLSGTAYGFPAYASSVTTTNFTAKRNDSNDVPTMWIAIGTANL